MSDATGRRRAHQDRLSDADSVLLTLDHDPLLRSSITVVVIFDREPPFTEVVQRFDVIVPPD